MGKDILIGIIAGLISGYIVSRYFESKNKKQKINNEIDYMIESLPHLRTLILLNKEKDAKPNDLLILVNNWQNILKRIKSDCEQKKYNKQIEGIGYIMEKLQKILEVTKNPINDFFEIANGHVNGIMIELYNLKNKYNS